MGIESQPFTTAPAPSPQLLYRCVCGAEVAVELDRDAICIQCQRRIPAEAIQLAMAATVSVNDVHESRLLESPDSLQTDDPLAGQLLGHFRLDHRIGAGGMGAVYRSLDTSLQRYVAVKVLRSGLALDASPAAPDKVSSLLQEAVAQARLNHPHVVTIYYVGRHRDEPFLAMELVTGPTLGERLRAGSLSYSEVARIGLHVADALRHANSFGIVHGDIKPSNLLMTSDGDVKLSDFGLSRVDTHAEEADKVAGTPAYLAPELLEGKAPTAQSDMYALGVTLFELTFRRMPFSLSGLSPKQWLVSHVESTPQFPEPWPRDVPYAWKEVLERLLAKKPEDRYGSYQELIKEMRRIQPVTATAAAVAPRTMAYALDQIMLLACLSPFAAIMLALEQAEALANYGPLQPIVAAAALIIPALHLLWVARGRSTLGRYLFQLRVVDEHGLPLDRGNRVTREFLRNMFSWVTPFAAYAGLYSPQIDRLIDGALFVFLAIDIACLILRRDSRTFHDILCRSAVVLDESRFQGRSS